MGRDAGLLVSAATGPTRAEKKRWRRRVSRAGSSGNVVRVVVPLRVYGDVVTAWAIRDLDRGMIVPPWERP